MKALACAVSLVLATWASGCGYSLAGRGTFLPAYIQRVGIPELENRTAFFRAEQVLTEKIRTEFIGRGKYTIVPEATGTDAVVSGEITNISAQPIGLTDQQLASRYLFTVTLRVRFTDARTNEVVWSNDALTFREEYELATRAATAIEGASFLDQQGATFDRIANDVARSVVTAIVEAF